MCMHTHIHTHACLLTGVFACACVIVSFSGGEGLMSFSSSFLFSFFFSLLCVRVRVCVCVCVCVGQDSGIIKSFSQNTYYKLGIICYAKYLLSIISLLIAPVFFLSFFLCSCLFSPSLSYSHFPPLKHLKELGRSCSKNLFWVVPHFLTLTLRVIQSPLQMNVCLEK